MTAPYKTHDPPPPSKAKADVPGDDKTDATARLEQFETEYLGEDEARIDGKIEQGHGSAFAKLSQKHRDAHAALEALVRSEGDLALAKTALAQAEDAHAAAEKRVADAAAAVTAEPKPVEPKPPKDT